jgi:tetratricopeptide (TPR) repeat protein
MPTQFLSTMRNNPILRQVTLLAASVLLAAPTLCVAETVANTPAEQPVIVAPKATEAEATMETPVPAPVKEGEVLQTVDDEPSQPSAYGELSEDGFVLDRLEARQAFWDYFDAQQYEQAVDVGELVVTLSEQDFGANDIEMAPVHNALGAALSRAGRPAEAVDHFQSSVGIYQDKIGIFAAEMIDPLMGLGLAQQDLGDHDAALGTFQRAQHLTHRDRGVNNLDQISIVQARVNSYMAQDRWQEAENLQLLSFKLYRRNFGKDNVETIPAMHRLARWYHDIMDYRQARIIYRQTLELLEDKYEGDHPSMIPALNGIAAAYLEEHSAEMGKGLKAHERVVSIIDQTPGYDPEARILAHLELGDWYVMFNDEDKAWEQYRIGWDLSIEQHQSERDWPKYFDRPHLIYPGASLSVDYMGYGVVGKEVYYDFKFTIGPDGRPQDINVLGSNLHGQTRSAAIHAFRYARFRPRMVEGSAVATTGYKVRRVYPTLPPEDYGAVRLGGG